MSVVWYFVLDSYHRMGAKHLALICILILYSLFGGWLFSKVEGVPDRELKNETFHNATLEYEEFSKRGIEVRARLLRTLEEIEDSVGSKSEKYFERERILKWYEEELKVFEFEEPELEETPWTFWGSIFYSATLYTTIGYGSFGPSTTAGQVATIFYALFGIPLTVTILNDWGTLLFHLMCFMWNGGAKLVNRIADVLPCCRRYCGCCLPEIVDEPKNGEKNDVKVENVPLRVALFVMAFWFCACAGIYCIWEDWDYFTGFYFFFISFTTIGLGDVVPERLDLAMASFVLVLMGLAVVALGLNVLQAKVESLFADLIKSIDGEYKEALLDDERGMGADDNEQLKGGADAMKEFHKKQGIKDQLVYSLMGEHNKKLLREKWDKKARLRNLGTQTGDLMCDSFMQTDAFHAGPSSFDDELDEVYIIRPDIAEKMFV